MQPFSTTFMIMENETTTSRTSMYRIADLRADERPRERLANHGAGSLSKSELLAILLRVGVEGE
ncbi:MAG: UPF0758 domain-containing protein, partial [Anaerolineaceae bacterium]